MRKSWTFGTLITAALVATVTSDGNDVEIDNNIPNECPEIDSIDKSIYLAHEWDCTKFYECDHGNRVLFECPLMNDENERLHFDPVLQECNWPENSSCINGRDPSVIEGGTTIELISTTTTTRSPINTTTSGTSKSFTHPADETTLSARKVENSTHRFISGINSTVTTASKNVSSNITESTSVPTTVLDQNTSASSGNYVPYENNCTIFYEIVNGTKVLRECPRGLHFSPTDKICISPSEAGCESTTTIPTTTNDTIAGSCGGIDNNWVVAHECVCSKYYLCSNGDLVLKKCPEGLHFGKNLYGCVEPDLAGCKSTTSTTATTIISTVEIPTECPPDNSGQSVQLPHPTNCSLYYKCDNGNKILRQCPQDLYFNPVLQMCDWADSAGCEINSSTVEGSETVTQSTETISEDSAASTSTIETPTECPPFNSGSSVHLPHPYNCSLYYTCDNGKKLVEFCPIGLEFNAVLQICDWPETSGCSVSTISAIQDTTGPSSSTTQDTTRPSDSTPQETTGSTDSTAQDTIRPSNSTPQSITRPSSSTAEDTTRPPSFTAQNCPPDNSGNATHLPHPTNCSLYYKCDNGKKVAQSCPLGLEFNAELQVCDWPETAGCVVSTAGSGIPWTTAEWSTSTPSISTTQQTTGSPSSITQQTTGSPSSITQQTTGSPSSTTQQTTGSPISTTQQTTGSPISTTQQTTGSPSSITQQTTESPTSTINNWSTTSSSSTINAPCSEGSKLPHKTNCSLFYECEDSKNVIKECSEGLHFNSALNICDWWQFAGCNVTTTPSISSSTASTIDNDVNQNNSTTDSKATSSSIVSLTPNSTVTVTPSTIKPVAACIGSCPNRDPIANTILLPNEDCTKFCMCSNGRGYVYDCPAHLHFNPTKLVCDYPQDAQCIGANGWEQSKIEVVHVSR